MSIEFESLQSDRQELTNAEIVLDIFRSIKPYTFLNATQISAIASEKGYDIAISNAIMCIRRSGTSMLNSSESIVTIDNSGGYIWTNRVDSASTFSPEGFRPLPPMYFTDNEMHAIQPIFEAMRKVTLKNTQLASPKVSNSVYDDFIYFVTRLGLFTHLDDFCTDAGISSNTGNQRLHNVMKFVNSGFAGKVKMVKVSGHFHYGLVMQ